MSGEPCLHGRRQALLAAGAAGSLLILGLLFYDSWIPVLLVLPAWPWLRRSGEAFLQERRRAQFRIQFRDLLNSLSGSFAVGRHLRDALQEADRELRGLYGAGSLVVGEVERLERSMAAGAREGEVLYGTADRWRLEEARDLARVYEACLETGGDVSRALERAAVMLGEKLTIENEIRVLVSQKKYESRMIALMPPLILIFLRSVSPGYLAVLYDTLAGRLLMTMALLMTAASFLMTERITKIDV